MKGFAKIALTVALMVVIVLSIVVASVAWFTSNPEVNANDVTLNAARTLTVTFDSEVSGTGYRYNGQIGNVAPSVEPDPDSDAPYVYEAGGFTLGVDTLSSDGKYGKVKVEFGTVTILYPTGTVSNVLISDLFTITANVYERNNEGAYVKDEEMGHFRAYNSETDSELLRYKKTFDNLTIADDGVLMKTVENTTSFANFHEGRFELVFTYTFLPEAAYAVWERACAGTPNVSFDDIQGYEMAAGGTHIGVVSYVPYKAKYHFGLQRYTKSATAVNGIYTYTPNDEGGYVRVVDTYDPSDTVTKYSLTYTPNAEGTHYKCGDDYIAAENATDAEKASGVRCNITATPGSGTYIKVGDSGDYVLFKKYNMRNGFPYHDDKYRGERFTFTVSCSVEEVSL